MEQMKIFTLNGESFEVTDAKAREDIKNFPRNLSQFNQDSEHRTVTDAEKEKWNSKQPAGNYLTVEHSTDPNAHMDMRKNIGALLAHTGLLNDVLGVEVDFENKSFNRIGAAVGLSAGADFDKFKMFGGRKRCNVSDDGTITAFYGEPGYREDGSNGQVMVEQPKFYYLVAPIKLEKMGNGNITRKVRYFVSDTPKEGFKLHPAFIENGKENEKIYLSAFEGSLWDASESKYILDDAQVADFAADKLSSIAGAKPASGSTQQLTRANARRLANNRGKGWEQAYIAPVSASQLLMLIEYASFNMQTAIGAGATGKTDDGASNMAENTGATVFLGNASGTVTNSNGTQIISYRGEENLCGNIWKWIDGINEYFNIEKGTASIYIADHAFTDDVKTAPYKDAGIVPSMTIGYVSAFCYSEEFDWLFIPGEAKGNSSLPVGDNFYQNVSTRWYVTRFGGQWNSGSSAGAFYWSFYSTAYSRDRSIGGRLVYVPSKNSEQ